MPTQASDQLAIATMAKLSKIVGCIRRHARRDDGMTLVELLVATGAMIVVVSAAFGMIEVALRSEPPIGNRASAIDRGRVTLSKLTHELRQTYSVQTAGSTQLNFYTYERVSGASTATQRYVSYDCANGSCVRREGPPNQALPDTGETVVTGLTNSDVFTFSPDTINPDFVKIKFSVSVPGRDPITIEDGVNLRNATSFTD